MILTWNDGALLDRAVESALSARSLASITIVDNGSEPPAQVVDDPRIRLLRNETNQGVARGRNQGARVGSAPFVCLLDSDAELGPGSLDRLADALEAHASVALVAPVFLDQQAEASGGRAPTLLRKVSRAMGLTTHYGTMRPDGAVMWDVEFAIGACQLVRREAFDAVGGLDESYFYGPEDVDFCLRLRETGWRVVQVAGPKVHHPARRRNRRAFTARGLRHGASVLRYLWRRRRFVDRAGR